MKQRRVGVGRGVARRLATLGAASAMLLGASLAAAQPAGPPPAPPNPAPEPGARPGEPEHRPVVLDAGQVDDPLARTLAAGSGPDVLSEALAPEPDGLRPEDVAARAADTSPAVAAAQADARAAATRVDQALAAYFPRLTLSASYTRLSEVENSFDLGIALPAGIDTSFPVVLNSFQLAASLEVPISDYIFRLTQAYAGASTDVEARELVVEARKLEVAAQAKITYFNWVRAKGRSGVAALASVQSDRHLEDARATREAGLASDADVLRLSAQVAQMKHLRRSADLLVAAMEEQLRTLMHLEPDAEVHIGVDVMAPPPEKPRYELPELQRMALESRLDRKGLIKTRASLDEVVSLTRASQYPRLSAFADLLYANPNPRVFPQDTKWDFTWDLGVRLTWTVNDTFTTLGAAAEAEERVTAVDEQLRALEDGIRTGVSAAYYDLLMAYSAAEAAEPREQAAVASADARRRLFLGGKATATDMVDAETELTQARLQRVDAHVDVLVAEARLEHAVGRPLR